MTSSPMVGGIVWFGILAAAMGSLLGLAVWAFGGGALLMVGGRYIVKSPKATYWRSVGTMALAGLGSGLVSAMVSVLWWLLPILSFAFGRSGADVARLVGLVGGLLVTWLIIKAMFGVSFGKAILAWLPTLPVAFVVAGMLTAALLPTVTQSQEEIKSIVCMSNLEHINLYKSLNNGDWPADLQTMIAKYHVSPERFVCPCVRSGLRPAGRTYDYFYFPPKSNADWQTIVACDLGGNHRDGSRNILRAAGSVHRMSAGEFQAEMADPANAAFAAALWQAEPSAGRTPNSGD